jgi:hypothetical protein
MEILSKLDQYYLALILDSNLELQERRVYLFQIVRVFRCGHTFLHYMALKRLTKKG